MFHIAVCDDESHFRKEVKEAITDYMKRAGISFHIDTFSSGKEFIDLGIGMIRYTIVFLDIHMNEIDGIVVAKKIREISNEVFIVFVSAYVNYTLEGYRVDAVRYILKNNKNFQKTLDECMNAIINKLNYKVVKKEFKFNDGVKEVSLERILYIESRLHKLEFHIMEADLKTYTMYETLNQIEKEIDDNKFVRIHQSFLVNLKYIKRVLRYKVVLNNGEELVISKARYKEVKDTFVVYQGEI
ncbi:MAG TPA: response regulator transcription factor [Clostridiales bacterium]|nr:response regulator transcription factor [Clostridiales bacterium]